MKILQVVQKPQRRGAEVFAFQLNDALRRRGHEARIAYLYPHNGDERLPLMDGDRILNGDESHPLEKISGVHPRLLRSLLRLIREFEPDVVQVNGGRAVKYGALARHIDRRASWGLVYRNIGHPKDWMKGRAHRLFYNNIVMPRLDGVVGVSKETLQAVRDSYGLSVPMAQIPRAVEPSALIPSMSPEIIRREAETPLDAPVILFIGSLTREKRLDRFMRMLKQVRASSPATIAWIIGDGPLRPELEQLAESLGITKAVRFLGVKSAVADYIKGADLFVLTSDTEGIPGVVLEAGLLELPAVSTRVGGVAECIRDGETGRLVDPHDEEKLADYVLALLQNHDARSVMGARAKRLVEANFSMEKAASSYIGFYRQVIQARAGVHGVASLELS